MPPDRPIWHSASSSPPKALCFIVCPTPSDDLSEYPSAHYLLTRMITVPSLGSGWVWGHLLILLNDQVCGGRGMDPLILGIEQLASGCTCITAT